MTEPVSSTPAEPREPDAEAWFTTADVEAARQRLADNRYGGDGDVHDLDRDDIHEIIQIVLTATWQRARRDGLRQATEGWARDLRYRYTDGQIVAAPAEPYVAAWLDSVRRVERLVGDAPGELQRRLVGPWEPAEQPGGAA